jgi:hypothetical protein
VLTNSDRNRLDAALFFRIVDAFFGEPEKDWSQVFLTQAKEDQKRGEEARKKAEESRVQGKKPSLDLASYCGKYENEMYGTAEVKNEEGKLVLYFNNKGLGVLDHWHYDTFRINSASSGSSAFSEFLGETFVLFRLNTQGRVATLEIEDLASFERAPESNK